MQASVFFFVIAEPASESRSAREGVSATLQKSPSRPPAAGGGGSGGPSGPPAPGAPAFRFNKFLQTSSKLLVLKEEDFKLES